MRSWTADCHRTAARDPNSIMGCPHTTLSEAVELSDHPISAFATYILNDMHKGFRIGFDRWLHLESSFRNLNKSKISSQIYKWLL